MYYDLSGQTILSIQSIKLETLVYTPGKLGLPQPIPKEVTPII